MNTIIKAILTSLTCFLFFSSLNAQITWTGAQDNNWNDPNNWDLGRIPVINDEVVISGSAIPGFNNWPVLQNDVDIASLNLITTAGQVSLPQLNLNNFSLTIDNELIVKCSNNDVANWDNHGFFGGGQLIVDHGFVNILRNNDDNRNALFTIEPEGDFILEDPNTEVAARIANIHFLSNVRLELSRGMAYFGATSDNALTIEGDLEVVFNGGSFSHLFNEVHLITIHGHLNFILRAPSIVEPPEQVLEALCNSQLAKLHILQNVDIRNEIDNLNDTPTFRMSALADEEHIIEGHLTIHNDLPAHSLKLELSGILFDDPAGGLLINEPNWLNGFLNLSRISDSGANNNHSINATTETSQVNIDLAGCQLSGNIELRSKGMIALSDCTIGTENNTINIESSTPLNVSYHSNTLIGHTFISHHGTGSLEWGEFINRPNTFQGNVSVLVDEDITELLSPIRRSNYFDQYEANFPIDYKTNYQEDGLISSSLDILAMRRAQLNKTQLSNARNLFNNSIIVEVNEVLLEVPLLEGGNEALVQSLLNDLQDELNNAHAIELTIEPILNAGEGANAIASNRRTNSINQKLNQFNTQLNRLYQSINEVYSALNTTNADYNALSRAARDLAQSSSGKVRLLNNIINGDLNVQVRHRGQCDLSDDTDNQLRINGNTILNGNNPASYRRTENPITVGSVFFGGNVNVNLSEFENIQQIGGNIIFEGAFRANISAGNIILHNIQQQGNGIFEITLLDQLGRFTLSGDFDISGPSSFHLLNHAYLAVGHDGNGIFRGPVSFTKETSASKIAIAETGQVTFSSNVTFTSPNRVENNPYNVEVIFGKNDGITTLAEGAELFFNNGQRGTIVFKNFIQEGNTGQNLANEKLHFHFLEGTVFNGPIGVFPDAYLIHGAAFENHSIFNAATGKIDGNNTINGRCEFINLKSFFLGGNTTFNNSVVIRNATDRCFAYIGSSGDVINFNQNLILDNRDIPFNEGKEFQIAHEAGSLVNLQDMTIMQDNTAETTLFAYQGTVNVNGFIDIRNEAGKITFSKSLIDENATGRTFMNEASNFRIILFTSGILSLANIESIANDTFIFNLSQDGNTSINIGPNSNFANEVEVHAGSIQLNGAIYQNTFSATLWSDQDNRASLSRGGNEFHGFTIITNQSAANNCYFNLDGENGNKYIGLLRLLAINNPIYPVNNGENEFYNNVQILGNIGDFHFSSPGPSLGMARFVGNGHQGIINNMNGDIYLKNAIIDKAASDLTVNFNKTLHTTRSISVSNGILRSITNVINEANGGNISILANGTLRSINLTNRGLIRTEADAHVWVDDELNNSGNFINNGNLHVRGDFFNEGAINSNQASANLILTGNYLENNGTFNLSNGSAHFQGDGLFEIEATQSLRFHHMNIEQDLSLLKSISVSGIMFIADGETIHSGNEADDRLITLTETASFNVNAAFIQGAVKKLFSADFNEAFVFPIGKNNQKGKIALNSFENVVAGDHFTAEYFDRAYEDLISLEDPSTTGETVLESVSNVEHWTLERGNNFVGSNMAAKVRLYWEDENRSFVDNLEGLSVAHWHSALGLWQNMGAFELNEVEQYVESNIVVRNFSPFTFGFTTPMVPLPVQLLNFEAYKNQEQVDLLWQMDQASDGLWFTLQRSLNRTDFEDIQEFESEHLAGLVTYRAIDKNVPLQMLYYRLAVHETNGNSTFSKVKTVDMSRDIGTVADIRIFPNPTADEVHVDFGKEIEACTIILTDLSGRSIRQITKEGAFRTASVSMDDLNRGIYLLKVQFASEQSIRRIIKL